MIEARWQALESERNRGRHTVTSASGRQPYDIFISYRTTHADWVETLADNSAVVICPARVSMLPLDQAEFADTDQGV